MTALTHNYYTELTWLFDVNNETSIHQVSDAKLKLAFPLASDPAPKPEPEPEVTPEVTEEAPRGVTPYDVAYEMFIGAGMPVAQAKRVATKAAEDIAMAMANGWPSPNYGTARYDRFNQLRHIYDVAEARRNGEPDPTPYTPRRNNTRVTTDLWSRISGRLAKAWIENGVPVTDANGYLKACNPTSGEIEVHSDAINDLDKFKWWYEYCNTGMAALGFTHERPGETSGGGHLHVKNLDGSEHNGYVVHWMMDYLAKHPYMAWAFLDYNDPRNGSPIQRLATMYTDHHRASDPSESNISWLWGRFGKGTALSLRRDIGSLEFRLFEMPPTWEVQKNHIMFCEALITKAKSEMAPVINAANSRNSFEGWLRQNPPDISQMWQGHCRYINWPTWENSRDAFKEALEGLGLAPEPFMERAEENLQRRYQLGAGLLV